MRLYIIVPISEIARTKVVNDQNKRFCDLDHFQTLLEQKLFLLQNQMNKNKTLHKYILFICIILKANISIGERSINNFLTNATKWCLAY